MVGALVALDKGESCESPDARGRGLEWVSSFEGTSSGSCGYQAGALRDSWCLLFPSTTSSMYY